MKRDTATLCEREFDLLVVGAGIHGAAVAWDAALRGLSTALIDKGDFVSGNSANCLKIIHGGIRYLPKAKFKRVRQSIRERSLLLRLAPHLVFPLPCLLPAHGLGTKSRPFLWVGLKLNDLISFDRNRSLTDPSKRIRAGRILSKKKCLELVPGLAECKLNGGAYWHDAQMFNSERLALSFVLSAVEAGAVAANYAAATGFLDDGDRIRGLKVKDELSGEEFEVRARLVINCGGAGVDDVLALLGNRLPPRVKPSSALNIIVDRRLIEGLALGFRSRFEHRNADGGLYGGSRVLFMTPWRGRTVIGTQHRPMDGSPRETEVSERHIREFIDEINRAFPAARIERGEVSFFNWGIIPMDGVSQKTGEVKISESYRLIDHAREDGVDGLITLIGVKYTTGRGVAEKAVDLAFRKLGRRPPRCPVAKAALAGGAIERFDEFLYEQVGKKPYGLDAEVITHLVRNYGSSYEQVLELLEEDARLGEKVPGSEEVILAEVLHAVRREAARKLADVVLRRTDLGSAGSPGKEALKACAEVMAAEMGWDKNRVEREIQEVEEVYIPKR
jgi:glycerol-3-phosphate dehydrogenase